MLSRVLQIWVAALVSAPRWTALWTANTDHATALPACFAFDEHAITVFLNGGRHLLTGAVPPHEEELPYGGDGNMAVVNSDLHTVPVRLTGDDVGITQEQWEAFMADLTATSDQLPVTDAVTGMLGLPGSDKHSVDEWRHAVQAVCDKHMEQTFVKGVSAVTLETACWTVTDKQRVSDVGDPVAVPQSMPVVRIKLQAGLYKRHAVAAGQQASGKQGSGAGGAGGGGDGAADGSGFAAYGAAGSSLLPWSKRGPWGVAPRIHGMAASTFHTGA